MEKGKGMAGALRPMFRGPFSQAPLLGWLFGFFAAVLIERLLGTQLALSLGLRKVPALFGLLIIFDKPLLIPSAMLYVLLIYVLPVIAVARLALSFAHRLSSMLYYASIPLSVAVHIALFYAILHLWSGMSDYRIITVKLTLIAIILTLSLNVINGYMGEFSCSHPGFMAIGAYIASAFTLSLSATSGLGWHLPLPSGLGPFLFPVAIIAGGITASIGALAVAIPSFRTRGDYLAIISLAFTFIVKSLIENLEIVGGPRGMCGQPDYASLPVVFLWTCACIFIINNFVRSTLGKALNAVRDDEMAAEAMTVNTRRTKIVAFLFSAFWAGVAGGLFAHVLRYVNPGSFGIQKLAEVLAMVYFGGLNSVHGSILGAVSLNLLSEALRPLEILKWIIIPLLFILVMIFRPAGLIAFREFRMRDIVRPKTKPEERGGEG